MFDATQILGGFLEGRQTTSMPGRLDAAVQQGAQGGMLQQVLSQFGGSASGGGLATLLGTLTSGAADQGGRGGSGGMLDQIMGMARRAAASPGDELAQNNPAAVGGLGALAGALLGGGRGALGGGVMAVLGSFAYSAFQNASAAPAGAPGMPSGNAQGMPSGNAQGMPSGNAQGMTAASVMSPATSTGTYRTPAETPAYTDQDEVQRKARLMFRAMVQAAKADGNIDDTESERLTSHLHGISDNQEARDFVSAEMRRPVDIPGLAAQVKSPAEAAEVYAASIMAMDVDTDAERNYLSALATALKLPPTVATHIHSSLSVKT
jgi:uncharacterized membrane protein YebE (DUF533 family)